MPVGWNDTNIVLIPKVKSPSVLKELRPSSLCNVVYKIISKVLANRLKSILPEIILDTQSAFVPGRLITDNVLIAYEATHFLQNKRNGKDGYAAIKLDMSKAYDRVEWPFLLHMLRRLGFDEKWNRLIMNCVTTVNYKIKVNGDYTEVIKPDRGLRQGDPLSPYLFVICAEAFSAAIQAAEDDSLLLLKATESVANEMKQIILDYERCSGQIVNRDKSVVMFSSNMDEEEKKDKIMKPKSQGGLGFRDLHSFNIAMLARQGWRLIQNPDSLCSRLLKAKYFPNCNVLDAQSRKQMSYSWRSILKGIQLLRKGVIWRVGNGEHINIWSDPWLPRDMRFVTTRRGASLITRVCELIDPTTGQWDIELIQQIFNENDAKIITRIPLREGQEDFIAWQPDTKGIFSVKSAYKLHEKILNELQGQIGEGGWGVVARDTDGCPLMMAAGNLQNLHNANQAEALACIQALKLANDMGMGHIIVETDAQALKAALLDETQDRSVNAVIIREAKFLLAMNFNVHQVMYCPRECNRAAHELAKIGASLGPRSQFVWLEGFPDVVCNLVASDSAGLPA
uniref:Reverse transcriptase n=1 Tax=Oryza sativa subsp. japonica TaxID=39947 RepID=Q8LMV3_ORYSJ|nr:putative reverse transcriptase [Oryza sativa Japonica Group]